MTRLFILLTLALTTMLPSYTFADTSIATIKVTETEASAKREALATRFFGPPPYKLEPSSEDSKLKISNEKKINNNTGGLTHDRF